MSRKTLAVACFMVGCVFAAAAVGTWPNSPGAASFLGFDAVLCFWAAWALGRLS